MIYFILIFIVFCIFYVFYLLLNCAEEDPKEKGIKVLFVDTETTGLPKKAESIEDLAADNKGIIWPEIVQLSYAFYNLDTGYSTGIYDYILKISVPIEAKAEEIHKITEEVAAKKGKDPAEILEKFMLFVNKADYIVIHNVAFDRPIIKANLLRYVDEKEANYFNSKEFIDTMILGLPICKIPNKVGGFKRPKLSELYNYLEHGDINFEELDGLHNAKNDVDYLIKIFFKLYDRGYLYSDKGYLKPNFFAEEEVDKNSSEMNKKAEI